LKEKINQRAKINFQFQSLIEKNKNINKRKKIKRIKTKKKPTHNQLGLNSEIKNNKTFIKWST